MIMRVLTFSLIRAGMRGTPTGTGSNTHKTWEENGKSLISSVLPLISKE